MKRLLIATAVLLLATGASAEYCYNQATGECYPNILGGCPEGYTVVAECPAGQPTPVPTIAPTPVPTPVPTPEPGNFFDTHGIKFGAVSLAKFLAFLTALTAAVQFIKKILENLSKWQWLLKLIPPLATVFAFLANGIGPIVINAVLTAVVLIPPALTDNLLSIAEIASIIGVIIGNDIFYRLIRDLGWLWPKKTG